MSEQLTSKQRDLPKLLREAERRVNKFLFEGARPSFASIPARPDRDVNLLLVEAADEIERLTRENAALTELYVEGGTALHTQKEALRDERDHLLEEYAKAERLWKETAVERERLREALKCVMPLLAECDCIYSDRDEPLCPCRAARAALSAERPADETNSPRLASDDIRDLACCDAFVRESASEFCAKCGYTNLDHLRKRTAVKADSNSTGDR